MKVILAENAGACYGVQRALDIAQKAADEQGRAYTLGPLIHNPGVVRDLAEQGVSVATDLSEIEDGTLIIRSHGITPEERERVEAVGLPILDATCPHVRRAQNAAATLGRNGCHVVVVGEQGHPEVAGLTAYARREGARVDVVSSPDELPDELVEPVGIVVQTTQRRENLEAVVEAMKARGIEPNVKSTICFATRQRQDAAADLAKQVDAMVVIGGRNSSNTTRLAEICRAGCSRAFHVESAEELRAEDFEGCSVIGVTAGASTPESQIRAVVELLESF